MKNEYGFEAVEGQDIWGWCQIINPCDIPCLRMIYHIISKIAVTSRGQEDAVFREGVQGASDFLVIFYILSW